MRYETAGQQVSMEREGEGRASYIILTLSAYSLDPSPISLTLNIVISLNRKPIIAGVRERERQTDRQTDREKESTDLECILPGSKSHQLDT